MDISLGRVLEAARGRRATLTPEVAGYVILLAAQQLAETRSRVSAHGVLLDEAGGVRVEAAPAASELDIETVLRALLGDLIALCSSPPPAIAGVAERDARGDLRGLVAELSAALIPINHSAAHRALARLYREARRAGGHLADMAPAPIAEPLQPRPAPLPEPMPHPAELEIDVVVIEPEMEMAAPARDLLAPDLPTPDPGVHAGAGEPLISHVADDSVQRRDEELIELPPARPRWTVARSDVQELLAAFLAETRSVEHVLRTLRDMIGLEVAPHRDVPGDSASIAPVPR